MLQGLAPVSLPTAKVLVLGSMPGAVSLQQQQYYGHPRNAFWPIITELTGVVADLPYQQRLQALTSKGIALWDVIASCERVGSLDSAIRQEQVNDFSTFFSQHPQLQAIAFNGAKAAQSFTRHVLPLQCVPSAVSLLTLPSTSPAHATLSFADKIQQWQQVCDYL